MEPLERRELLAGGVPTPDHVVILFEENRDYNGTNGENGIVGYSGCPYINSFITGDNTANAAVFTQSYALQHPSQPNYIEFFSGSNQGVNDDNVPPNLPFTTPNVGAALLQKGLSFAAYSEDLPDVGFTGATSGYYASKHCPWVNWQDAPANGIPAADNQPLRIGESISVGDYGVLW
jgi:phosphatidylinositol-3-phosphatase